MAAELFVFLESVGHPFAELALAEALGDSLLVMNSYGRAAVAFCYLDRAFRAGLRHDY